MFTTIQVEAGLVDKTKDYLLINAKNYYPQEDRLIDIESFYKFQESLVRKLKIAGRLERKKIY